MPLTADHDRPDKGSAITDALGVLGDLEEVRAARGLPAIIVGLLLAFPIFLVAAIVLAIVLYGAYAVFQPTGLVANLVGIVWFGGSLAITAIAIRPLLRWINGFLARRSWPTLY